MVIFIFENFIQLIVTFISSIGGPLIQLIFYTNQDIIEEIYLIKLRLGS